MRRKLVKLREQLGYTQYSFADAAGMSRSHYSQIETGEKAPSLDFAIRIKRVLGYEQDDIFLDYSSPKSKPIIDKYKKKRR